MNKLLKNSFSVFLLLFAILFISSCGEDDEPDEVVLPFAGFTLEVGAENTLTVSFTNTSLDGESFAWDFGDNIGTSTEENPTYTYTASGTYTITLTVTNSDGDDSTTEDVTVSGFGPNLVVNGDMSDASAGWTSVPLWVNDDNGTEHRITEGVFRFQNAEDGEGGRFQWSNHFIQQEIPLEAGSTYQFSADVSSTSGTLATWFEVYLVNAAPIDESTIGGDATQIAIKSFGEGEDCTATEFSGDIIEIAANCSAINNFVNLIGNDGQFTVSAEDLSADGTIFLVFKAGSGFAPEGEIAGFREGIDLDNVVIQKVL